MYKTEGKEKLGFEIEFQQNLCQQCREAAQAKKVKSLCFEENRVEFACATPVAVYNFEQMTKPL